MRNIAFLDLPRLRAQNFLYMTQQNSTLHPVLVDFDRAAELMSVDRETIDYLVKVGDLPVRLIYGKSLIPYRSLLILAGVGRWKYQEIIEA